MSALFRPGDERDGPVVGAFPERIPPFGMRVLWANVAQTTSRRRWRPTSSRRKDSSQTSPSIAPPSGKLDGHAERPALPAKPAKAPASIRAASLIGGDRDCRLMPSI